MNPSHFIDEPCEPSCGPSCRTDDRVRAAKQREEAKRGQWAPLVQDGDRHYLEGEPIHCGDALELQAIEVKADDFGEYTVWLQKGRRVRYELAFSNRGTTLDDRAVLHIVVDGHEFVAGYQKWMRFRRAGGAR